MAKRSNDDDDPSKHAHHAHVMPDVDLNRFELRRLSDRFEKSNPPLGFMTAAGSMASSIVTVARSPTTEIPPPTGSHTHHNSLHDSTTPPHDEAHSTSSRRPSASTQTHGNTPDETLKTKPLAVRSPTQPFENGYHFPPTHPFLDSLRLGTIAFFRFAKTPMGFFVVVYGLNVVAWGGMLFLLLCNASPAMCHPTCNDINSPRRKWIEYDSQVVNALFCVTGFGLAPWRFRDAFWLVQYRVRGMPLGLRKLGGVNRGWLRLPASHTLPPTLGPDNLDEHRNQIVDSLSIPFPEEKVSDAPRTGMRASPTPLWKVDASIWLNVANTVFQCVLAGLMWGMNRHRRPSWSVGLFVGLGICTAAAAGLIIYYEGRRVKAVEGVEVTSVDLHRLRVDRERGIPHYNNLRDKKPKL